MLRGSTAVASTMAFVTVVTAVMNGQVTNRYSKLWTRGNKKGYINSKPHVIIDVIVPELYYRPTTFDFLFCKEEWIFAFVSSLFASFVSRLNCLESNLIQFERDVRLWISGSFVLEWFIHLKMSLGNHSRGTYIRVLFSLPACKEASLKSNETPVKYAKF